MPKKDSDELAAVIAALSRALGVDDYGDADDGQVQVESQLPVEAGLSLIAAVRDGEAEPQDWHGQGPGLDAAVRALAVGLDVAEAEVWAALDAGDERVVREVLELAAGREWLAIQAGRGGRPLSRIEAGLDRAKVNEATGNVVLSLEAARKSRSHWWSRR